MPKIITLSKGTKPSPDGAAFHTLMGISYLPVLICFLFCSCSSTPEKPNVIIVITDDQGYGDLACHGNPWIKTPSMDQLWAESVRLTDYHVSPTCAPTTAALMTGRYNNRTGVWHTVTGRTLLRENELTMAQIFKDNGYSTGMFGKWHLGDNYPRRPMDVGFQKAVYHGGGAIGNTNDYWDNDYFDDHYYDNGTYRQFEGYCTDVWFREAQSFIEKNKDGPFFCYIATNAPHGPLYVEDRYSDPYKGDTLIPSANFYGMIGSIDENLGKLRNYLKAQNLDRNTIFIFMTDNGTADGVTLDGHWSNGLPTVYGYGAGMRGKKASPYDSGHREGDQLVKHWTFKGKHTGAFFGIPATGNMVEISGSTIIRMSADGRIAAEQDFMDNMALVSQLGAASAPGNVAVVGGLYQAFAKGDVPAVPAVMDAGIVWNEAEGFPYADRNPYKGPDAVLNGVFARIGAEWEYFN